MVRLSRSSSTARSAAGWAQLESYHEESGYDPRALGDVESIASWLDARRPRTMRPGLIHGDFQLGNLLFSYEAPNVAAVIDWEMATLGDVRIDLGFLMATVGDGSKPSALTGLLGQTADLPTPDAVLDHYQAAVGTCVDEMRWFVVLACLKTAAAAEGTYARSLSGSGSPKFATTLHRISLELLESRPACHGGRVRGLLPRCPSALMRIDTRISAGGEQPL